MFGSNCHKCYSLVHPSLILFIATPFYIYYNCVFIFHRTLIIFVLLFIFLFPMVLIEWYSSSFETLPSCCLWESTDRCSVILFLLKHFTFVVYGRGHLDLMLFFLSRNTLLLLLFFERVQLYLILFFLSCNT